MVPQKLEAPRKLELRHGWNGNVRGFGKGTEYQTTCGDWLPSGDDIAVRDDVTCQACWHSEWNQIKAGNVVQEKKRGGKL